MLEFLEYRFSVQLQITVLTDRYLHVPAVRETAEQQFLCQRSFDLLLDYTRHRSRAHLRILAAFRDPLSGFVIKFQRDIVVAEFGFELDHELVHNAFDRINIE